MTATTSPEITRLAWGRVEIEGRDGAFKDVKLFPGGAREWDWNETGTRHRPGIQPADVRELLDHGAETVVLSTGVYERLGVCEETLRELEAADVEVHVARTEDAARIYAELRRKGPVGALIHSTC